MWLLLWVCLSCPVSYEDPVLGFTTTPGDSDSKESACNAGDRGSVPESGKFPGGGHGNPLQCSCLEHPHEQRSLAGHSPRGCKESVRQRELITVLGSFQVYSTVSQLRTCSFFTFSFHTRSLRDVEENSLCYPVVASCLSVFHVVVCALFVPNSAFNAPPTLSPSVAVSLFSVSRPDLEKCQEKDTSKECIWRAFPFCLYLRVCFLWDDSFPETMVSHSHQRTIQGQVMLLVLQPLIRVRLCATPWTAARQASLSISNSQTLSKLMSIESVMPSNHLLLCCPLLLLPSIFPSSRVFSSESALPIRWPKDWSFSFSISPSNEYSGLISFRSDWFDLRAVQGTLKSLLQRHSSKHQFLGTQPSSWSNFHIHT